MWLIDRYGSAIEYDLRTVCQVDLADLARGTRTPREILNLLDRLPSASHFKHAQATDEELAEIQADKQADKQAEQVDGDAEPEKPDLPFFDWTPELQALYYLADLIGEQLAVLYAQNSEDGQVRHPKPLPRPQGALERKLKERAEQAAETALRELLSQFE